MENRYDIFISYRRLDEQGNISGRDQARLIAKQLQLEGYRAFFDYSEICDNEFDKVIIPAVENCKVFILVLTKDALNRCVNKDDWVRKEIETALSSGCKIINVTPDNTFNGWPSNLPSSLDRIKKIHIADIQFGQLFEVSIKKLIEDRIEHIVARHDLPHSTDSILSQLMEVRYKLTDLAFKYDEHFEKSSDESLSIDERKRAFMDSAKTIGKIVQLYRDTRLLYPESVRSVLDDKLNQCDEKAEDGLLKLIVFVQSFNEEICKLSEN